MPDMDSAAGGYCRIPPVAGERLTNSDLKAGTAWFAILLAAAAPSGAALWYMHGAKTTGATQAIYFVTKVLIFAFPAAWWQLAERRSWRGRPRQQPPKWAGPKRRTDLTIGLGTGCFIGACIWAGYWLAFRPEIDTQQLVEHSQRFGADRHYVALALFLAVINSGLEEYYWRWFVFGRLRAVMNTAAAVALSSLAFASHHFIVLHNLLGDAVLAGAFTFAVALGGAVWACQYHLTRRLWGAWLSHFLVDSAILSVGHHILVDT